MSHVRNKRGRVVVTSPATGKAHGRALATAPAVRTRIEPGDPAERLAYALVERVMLKRGASSKLSARAIKARIDRARDELATHANGAEEARSITTGLTANGGALLRTVEQAAPDARAFAARAAVRFVALIREHQVTSTAAVVMLASAAQWSALGEMLRDRAFALGVKGDGFGDALKLAASCSGSSRLDLLGALQLEAQARAARASTPRILDFAAAEQRLREHQAASVEATPDDERTDDVESSDDGSVKRFTDANSSSDENDASDPDEPPEDVPTPKTRERGAEERESSSAIKPPTPVRIPASPPVEANPVWAAEERRQLELARATAVARERDRAGAPLMPTRQRWDGRQWRDDERKQ